MAGDDMKETQTTNPIQSESKKSGWGFLKFFKGSSEPKDRVIRRTDNYTEVRTKEGSVQRIFHGTPRTGEVAHYRLGEKGKGVEVKEPNWETLEGLDKILYKLAVDKGGHSRFGGKYEDEPRRFHITTPNGLEGELDIMARETTFPRGKDYIDFVQAALFWRDEQGSDGMPPGGRFAFYDRLNQGGRYHTDFEGAREATQQDVDKGRTISEYHAGRGPFEKNVYLTKWVSTALAEQWFPSMQELTGKVEDGTEQGTRGNTLRILAMYNSAGTSSQARQQSQK